jgi:hypothetical protein
MNFNVGESNPIMTRVGAHRGSKAEEESKKDLIINTITTSTPNCKENFYGTGSNLNSYNDEMKTSSNEISNKQKIYKPPVRSQSSTPMKNLSKENVNQGTQGNNHNINMNNYQPTPNIYTKGQPSTPCNNQNDRISFSKATNSTKTSEKTEYLEDIDYQMNNLNINPNRNNMNNQRLSNSKNDYLTSNTYSGNIQTSSYNNYNNLNSNSSLNLLPVTQQGNYPSHRSNLNSKNEVVYNSINSYNANNNSIKNNQSSSQSSFQGNNMTHNKSSSFINNPINNSTTPSNLRKDLYNKVPILNHNQNPVSIKSLSSNNNSLNNLAQFNPMNNGYNEQLGYKNLSNTNFYQNNYYPTSNSSTFINLEDLMLLEEKLSEILYNLNFSRQMSNECFEWWNFYFNCSLCGNFEFYFKEESHKNVIRDYTHLEMLSIIISYDVSHDKTLLDKISSILKSIVNLLHQNFLIICDYIISKVAYESQSNMWVGKLRNLVETKMTIYKNTAETSHHRPSSNYMSEIKSNNAYVYDYLRIILKNYNTNSPILETLISYFKNISKINIDMLNDFYRSKVLRVMNKNASVLASVLINKDEWGQVAVPYLKKESFKEYTLVLDLDETLIHFKIDNGDETKGLLRLRPGIFEFLDCVSQYYELIVFTAATQDVRKNLNFSKI